MPDAEKQKILNGDRLFERERQKHLYSSSFTPNIPQPHDIIDYISRKYSLKYTVSIRVLLMYFGINFGDIFTTVPPYRLPPNGALHLPVFSVMSSFCVDGTEYTISAVDPQYAFAGYLEQCLLTYTSADGRSLHLMATLSQYGHQYELSVGHGKIQANLLPHVDIDRNSRARVIIVCDLDQAVVVRQCARAVCHAPENTIVSGYYGGKETLKALDVSVLTGHDVTIVPSMTREGLKEAEELYKLCQREHPRSIRMFLGVIAIGETLPPANMHSLPSWQQSFWENTVTIRSDAPFGMSLEDIFERAVDGNTYNQWEKDHALAGADEAADASSLAIEASSLIQCQSLADISAATRDHNQPVSIDEYFSPESTTMLWGASNTRKSWIVVKLIISIEGGRAAFFLAPSPRLTKRKVGYVDGELGGANFKSRFNQICKGDGLNAQEIARNIDHIHIKSSSLLKNTVQRHLLAVASEKAWDVIIIDNIQACASEAVKGKATVLTDFITELKDTGITVILINHAKKYGDNFKGDGALEDMSQNIVRVASVNDRNECPPNDSLAQEDAIRDPNQKLFQLTVIKCKVNGNLLEDKSAIYQLPTGGTWEYVDGELPHFDDATPPPSPTAHLSLPEGEDSTANGTQQIDSHEEFVQTLSPQDEALYFFMKQKGKFTREDIDTHLGVSKRTSQNRLKKFTGADIITDHGGKGLKNTFYTFNN